MNAELSDQNLNEFYQSLGNIFYAVAASDRAVSNKEFKELKTIVKEKWLDVDVVTDDYGEDAAYQIEIVFDYLKEKELDAEQCIQEFKDFKQDNEQLFTKQTVELIWKTCDRIATSFYGLNKNELNMLHRVKTIVGKP